MGAVSKYGEYIFNDDEDDNDYPHCCSVAVLADFNRALDNCDDEDYELMKGKVLSFIAGIKRGQYHTVAMVVLIRQQKRVIELFQELGWYTSPKFMRKTGYSEGGNNLKPAGSWDKRTEEQRRSEGSVVDTVIFFLPLGDEVD